MIEIITTNLKPEEIIHLIYARLSVENSGKNDDGDSIENQVSICREYIEERPYLSLTEVFSDNGAKGTSFERPEFNRMMDMIKAGKINAVVCKDLSRFGRDYIETGNYLEKYSRSWESAS